jgi:hypothetical protein
MEQAIQELRIWLARRNIPLAGIEIELIQHAPLFKTPEEAGAWVGQTLMGKAA